MPARLRRCLAPLLCLALPAHAADWQYVTVPGDTLIGIGQQYLKNPNDWPKVQSENKVEIPRRMPADFRLRIPVALLKVTPAPVSVTAVSGNVRYKGADGGFRPLREGDRLNGGETVLTGPRSSASFRFADGTQLTQQASSKLGFGRLAAYGKTGMISTELNLESGRIETAAARQQAPAGGFQVRTPVAVAGLRGTAFRVGVAEDGRRMSSEVTEGVVAVNARGRTVDVAAGYGTLAEAGRPPVTPRALLAAPDLGAVPATIQRLPLQFTKPEQPGAVAWRARVTGDEAFGTVLRDDVFTGQTAQWTDDLPDGEYFLRARAIDAAGLEGLEAVHRFVLDARPLPPVPVAPALGERLYQTQADFAWSAVPDAHGYVLQIAPTPEFANGVIERKLPAVVRHQEILAEGDWHWRVASVDETGKTHLFSPHRAFRVQPLPLPPAGGQSKSGTDRTHFTWESVRGADRYGLEVTDVERKSRVASEESRDTAAAATLAPGSYVWRVRGVEADGQAGGWSADNKVIVPPPPPRELRLDAKTLALTWQGEARRHRVEIAADAAFARPVARQEVEGTRALLKDLPPGDYFVRVIALGAEDSASLPSASLPFTVEHARPWWLLIVLPLLVF